MALSVLDLFSIGIGPSSSPHGGSDARRPPLHPEHGPARRPAAHRARGGGAVRLPRRHGHRPRLGHRRAPRPGRPGPGDHRPGRLRGPRGRDPPGRPHAPGRPPRDRLRPAEGHDTAHAPHAARAPQRHAPDSLRRRRRAAAHARLLLRGRRLRGHLGRARGRAGREPGRQPPRRRRGRRALPVRHGRRARRPLPHQRAEHRRAHARQRGHPPRPGRAAHPAAGHLGRHAGVRAQRRHPDRADPARGLKVRRRAPPCGPTCWRPPTAPTPCGPWSGSTCSPWP